MSSIRDVALTASAGLRSAAHSAGSEDRTSALSRSDGSFAVLSPNEQITLEFEAPPSRDGMNRTYVLDIEGHYERLESTQAPNRVHFDVLGVDPVRSQVRCRFGLVALDHVRVDVHAVDGRRVRTLADGRFPAGSHELWWDGRDGAGKPVASGAYFLRFRSGAASESKRITMLR